MAENFFGPPSKDDIKVGYIDPELGYVSDITICQANSHAEKNPGTTFIFRDGDNNLRYLNINKVNQLTPEDLVSTASTCGGIQDFKECGPPRIQIFGGGGVGAAANAVVGLDGSILAVDIVRGGHGYQYPPLVAAKDECENGNGASFEVELGEISEISETYEDAEDFEEYEICPDTTVGYGRNWGPNGEDLGPWEPDLYTSLIEDPIRKEIENFEKSLANPFWTTRKAKSVKASSLGESFNLYNVTFPAWNEFMNKYAISPIFPSNLIGSDYAGRTFKIEWVEYFPSEGEYIFRGLCDNSATLYVDDQSIASLASFNDAVLPIRKTLTQGLHTIKVELINVPITETITTSNTSTNTQNTTSNLKAKFVKDGSNFYLQVDGTGSAEISFVMDVNDASYLAGLAAKEVWIPTDNKKIKLKRKDLSFNGITALNLSVPTEETIKGDGTFTGGRRYGPIEIIGADPAARGPIIKSSNRLSIRDAEGDDENIKITISKIKAVSSTTSSSLTTQTVETIVSSRSWNQNPMGVALTIDAPPAPVPQEQPPVQEGRCPPSPIWSTRFPGSTQKWYPVNFFAKKISTSVIETTNIATSDEKEVDFTVYGQGAFRDIAFQFVAVDGSSSFTIKGADKNKKTRTEKVKVKINVNYVVKAIEDSSKYKFVEQGLLENRSAERGVGSSNKIFADYTSTQNDNDDIQIISAIGKFTSSNKRKAPGGRRNTYDLTYKLEASPNTKNNNVVTDIFETLGWSKFMNRYAISPIKPLDTPGSDASGINYSNSWDVDLPYSGFYGVKGTVDNRGRLLIDGNEVSKMEGFNVSNPKLSKVFLTKGKHTITVEVYNRPVVVETVIDKKIFNSKDWHVAGTISQSPTITTINSDIKAKFVQKNNQYFLEVTGNGSGEISFVMDVNDAFYIAGVAAKEIKIPSDEKKLTFKRNTFLPNEEVIKNSGKFSAGKTYGPIEIIGAVAGAGKPTVSNNKLGFLDAAGTDENIKLTISNIKTLPTSSTQTSTTINSGILTNGTVKDGVTYQGPDLFHYTDKRWGSFMNEYSVSPKVFESIDQPSEPVVGKYKLIWKNVNFPQDGSYKFNFQADNIATLRVGGREIYKTTDFVSEAVQYNFNATAGKYDVEIELENIKSPTNDGKDTIFSINPMGVALYISKDVTLTDTNKTPWTQNPIGISAVLIPPPCPKLIRGKGVVKRIIPREPGNGYLPPSSPTSGYPVILELEEVIPDNPGINYDCAKDQIKIFPDNGAKLKYRCDTFGRITEVIVTDPGTPFTIKPTVTIESDTGVNATFTTTFRVVRDPIVAENIIQVTDLVGLKQTGYREGRPYYGAIYYENGLKYAGYYKTVGQPVRIYDTLEESITGEVTTPASAIQRSGTDITSNDPRLNIPGTPENTV